MATSDYSQYFYLRLCRPDKFRVMDAPPRHLDATNVRFGTCKSVADKHDEIMAVSPDNGFMAMSIRLANGEESEQLEDIVVSMVRDNSTYTALASTIGRHSTTRLTAVSRARLRATSGKRQSLPTRRVQISKSPHCSIGTIPSSPHVREWSSASSRKRTARP